MKFTTSLLFSSILLALTSCKSDDATAKTDEPTSKTEPKTEKKSEAPPAPKPVKIEPVAPAPVVKAADPFTAPPTPPAPAPAPVVIPKKMTIEELAANIDKDPKAVANKVASLQNDLAKLMESVVDTESAELALFELDPIVDDMKILGEAMGSVDREIDPELTAELKKIAAAPQARLQASMMQAAPVFMADPNLRTKLQGTMQKLMQARKVGQ
jgi:hypothetical protein